MLSLKPEDERDPPLRWKIGVGRSHVAIFVGVALLGGFVLGFATARFMNSSAGPATFPLSAAEAAIKREKALKGDTDGAPPAAAADSSGADYHTVTRIVRADTIEVQGVGIVRLIGVETPDGKQPQQIYAAHGQNAVAFAEKALLNKEVRVEYDPANGSRGNRDAPGNILAYLFTRDGGLFNGEMVKQGHAFVLASVSFKHLEEFRTFERDAMQAMRGVWGFASNNTTSNQTAAVTTPAAVERKKLSPMASSELDPRGGASGLSTEPLVYTSASDRLYHKEDCEYLSKKRQAITVSQAKAGGFVACGRCFASTVMKAP